MTGQTARGNPCGLLSCGLSPVLLIAASAVASDNPKPRLVSQGLAGYISMDVPAPPDEYGYGVSLYSTAWPLVEPKTTTAGLPVTTGNQCWTLFINAANFKGPVAFYTPVTWSRISRRHPPAVGRGRAQLWNESPMPTRGGGAGR